MASSSTFVAAAATILFHAGLVAVAVTELSTDNDKQLPHEPLEIKLVRPAPVVAAAPLATPSAPEKQPEKKSAGARPIPQHKPKAEPHEATSPPEKTAEPAFERKAVSPATALSPPPAPAAPAPGPAQLSNAPPSRTSASDASYASSNRKPPYPRLSRSNEEEGTVVLRVLVKPDGTAGAVEIKNSSGYPLLDESAKGTVQSWRFKPATVDGKPVAEWYQVAIPFTLQNN